MVKSALLDLLERTEVLVRLGLKENPARRVRKEIPDHLEIRVHRDHLVPKDSLVS